jgi:hypothetical protein
MDDRLKTDSAKLDALETLRATPAVLLGVDGPAAAALKQIEIDSVFDLATSRLFANAERLLQAGLDPKDPYFRFGSAPKDVVNTADEDRRIDELRFEDIAILEGLDATTAAALADALAVKTVRDLALWPPYRAARAILNEAYSPEQAAGFDPEAPPDLLPKSGEYPTERVFYHTLVLDEVGAAPDKALEDAGPIDLAPTLDEDFGFKHLGIGALLTISQSWYAQGVALGQLLHSTALAPGESTRIAMMDWARRTRAGTTETISESEQLDNETLHGRSLSEVTKAVANEAQEGFSSTTATGSASQKGTSTGSATINADPLNAITGGLLGDDPGVTTGGTSSSDSTTSASGMTYTSSSGNRSLEASMTQDVMDRTQQHANSVRNRRASIVREVSQEEHQSVSTRVVTNYNHMHALSIQYYEVVQIYRVEAGISDVEKCIFIPMKLIDFTQPMIDKYRLVLARSALDRHAYDMLTTRYGVVELMPQTPRITPSRLVAKMAATQVATAVLRENLFSLMMEPVAASASTSASAAAPVAVAAAAPSAIRDKVSIRPSLVDVLAAKGYDLVQVDYAAKAVGRSLVRVNSDSLFLPRDTVIMGLVVAQGSVAKVQAKARSSGAAVELDADGVSLAQPLQVTEIESVRMTSARDDEQSVTLVLQCNYLGVAFPLSIKLRLSGGSAVQDVLRFGVEQASTELVDYLKANRLYYSQAIYRSLDAASLALLLSPYSYRGKPLMQQIDPTPVTWTANYLVFRMHEEAFEQAAGGQPVMSEWGQWLKDHGISMSKVKTELVPLPSGGVFAEAVLGRYNGSEKLDMTRFWNWQDSPIPITPPDIAPVEMTSRAEAENLKPGQLGAPVVSIVNPTTLPEPTGLAAALQAIQNGNMFRDMSGLAATMGLTQAALNAASQGATAAGSQAGANAATAAQLLSDLAKTAASVMTMGAGGAAAGLLAGGAGMLGGSSGGNISHAGALMNQGRSLDSRGAQQQQGSGALGGMTGGGTSGGDMSGGGAGGGSAGGGSDSGGADGASGSGFTPAAGGSEQAAFQRAVWGPAGESQADTVKSLFGLASGGMGSPGGGGTGSGTPGGGSSRPWTTECMGITIDASDKKQSECMGVAIPSTSSMFSDCGHMEHFCTVPATFGFRIMFHVDYLGVGRPKPFTPPIVSIDVQFVVQEGGVDKVIFQRSETDTHPVYGSPGATLLTSFGSKFNISTNKNGKFKVKLQMDDPDTGIHLVYTDVIDCIIVPCV